MRTNLTDRAAARAKPKSSEYLLNDGNGLSLRVLPSGTKSWLFRMTRKGKESKLSLGIYPDVSLARARELTAKAREDIALGKDLNSSTDENPTHVDELFEKWFKDYVLEKRESAENNAALRGRYENYVKPKIGKAELNNLRRGLILSSVLDPIVRQGKLRQANLVLSEMRQMFTYAAVREWILGDPTVGISKNDVGGEESVGERILSEDELRVLKQILTAPRTSGRVKNLRTLPLRTELAVWLALSTLTRSVEIATVRAEDINLETLEWWIPPGITKNRTPHIVHLNRISKRVFEILLSIEPEGYLFKGRGSREFIQPKAFTRELTDRQGREKPLKGRRNTTELLLEGGPWTMHDLRRTGATMMGDLNFDEKLIDLCLNHKEVKKVRRTYQKQQRLPERRRAFEALGEKIIEVLGSDDFLPTP